MEIPKPDGPDIDVAMTMLVSSWTLYGIAGLVLAGRVYTQVKISRQFGLGDIVMLIAMGFGLLQMVFITLANHHGWGRHFFYLTDRQRVLSMEMEFISEPFAILCSTLGRISFILLMFRLFGNTKQRRWFLYFLIGQGLVVNLMTCITIFTQCGNVRTLWDPIGVPSKCWDPNAQAYIGYFQGACNSLTDLILTVLPSTIFWTMQMEVRIKLGLVALLGLSIFAFVASIIKTVKLQSLGERLDYTFNTVNFMNWVVVENTLVMIASSVPLMRPLFKKVQLSARTRYGSSNAYELGSRGADKQSNAYIRSHGQPKSTQLASSSEENILPLQKGSITKRSTVVQDEELGGDLNYGMRDGIKKEVKVEVRYDDRQENLPSKPPSSAQLDWR